MRQVLIGLILIAAFAFGFFYEAPFENKLRPAHAAWMGTPPEARCSEETNLKSRGGSSRTTPTASGNVRACIWNIDSTTYFMCGVIDGAAISCQWIIKG